MIQDTKQSLPACVEWWTGVTERVDAYLMLMNLLVRFAGSSASVNPEQIQEGDSDTLVEILNDLQNDLDVSGL